MSVENHKLEARIRKAFACNAPLSTPLPYDFSEMNHKISRYANSYVRKYLPLLLIKEMESEQRSPTSTGDHLIYFLDGYLLARQGDTHSYKTLLDIQQETFADFGREEAQAILKWLEIIAFPKYRDLCADDLDSAIKYWRDKALETVGSQ